MCSLGNSRRIIIEEDQQNIEQVTAKNNLYELAEAQDRLNLYNTYTKSLMSSKIDSIDKWANNRNTIGYNVIHKVALAEGSDPMKRQSQGIFHAFPKLRAVKNQRSESPKTKLPKSTQQNKRITISMNDIFESKINKAAILRERRSSQTPNIEIAREINHPNFMVKKQDPSWYVSRPAKNRQRSASGAVNIIKRNTQSISKQNKKPLHKTVLKEIQKLRNDWMGFQKYKQLKVKDKLNLISSNH